MTTTITVDPGDLIELAEILDYLVGSVDTLVTPATIAPSADGDAYDLNHLRTDITRLMHRLLPNPLPSGAHADDDPSELIAVCRADIEDTALLPVTQATLTRWIGELASYLRRLLANDPMHRGAGCPSPCCQHAARRSWGAPEESEPREVVSLVDQSSRRATTSAACWSARWVRCA